MVLTYRRSRSAKASGRYNPIDEEAPDMQQQQPLHTEDLGAGVECTQDVAPTQAVDEPEFTQDLNPRGPPRSFEDWVLLGQRLARGKSPQPIHDEEEDVSMQEQQQIEDEEVPLEEGEVPSSRHNEPHQRRSPDDAAAAEPETSSSNNNNNTNNSNSNEKSDGDVGFRGREGATTGTAAVEQAEATQQLPPSDDEGNFATEPKGKMASQDGYGGGGGAEEESEGEVCEGESQQQQQQQQQQGMETVDALQQSLGCNRRLRGKQPVQRSRSLPCPRTEQQQNNSNINNNGSSSSITKNATMEATIRALLASGASAEAVAAAVRGFYPTPSSTAPAAAAAAVAVQRSSKEAPVVDLEEQQETDNSNNNSNNKNKGNINSNNNGNSNNGDGNGGQKRCNEAISKESEEDFRKEMLSVARPMKRQQRGGSSEALVSTASGPTLALRSSLGLETVEASLRELQEKESETRAHLAALISSKISDAQETLRELEQKKQALAGILQSLDSLM
mmetsp:Transcript_41144/g.88812  ORF Transcript_41144/g.88812 Transcript_41144/m.88812 type:complete len:504 (+) Transcript_41144:256-1767(+)